MFEAGLSVPQNEPVLHGIAGICGKDVTSGHRVDAENPGVVGKEKTCAKTCTKTCVLALI